ncbi:hypothetical protein VTN49DRAFT_4368 [Thermomyces lanuginosus]|uniref:uncharacterized protein n=1 Tax=Thermomyces lanuginosus TaxID=5541 RepID=UPI003743F32B
MNDKTLIPQEWWTRHCQTRNTASAIPLLATESGASPDGKDLEGLDAEKERIIKEIFGGRRPAFASEVADVVAVLCISDAAWCTGSVVNADGGCKFTVQTSKIGTN